MQTIIKPAYNEEWRLCEFKRPDGRGQLGEGEIIVSAAIICKDSKTQIATTAITSGVTPINETQVLYQLKGGTRAQRFIMQIQIITSGGNKLEEAFSLEIV